MNDAPKYLIIGQGLAGSVLCHQFHEANITFDIIDNSHQFSASKAAGGIMHPMSFKRLILAWKALEYIPIAKDFYNQIQPENEPFFQSATFYRPFLSIEEQNNWMAKRNDAPFSEILGVTDDEIPGLNSPYGIGTIEYSGRLEVNDFLSFTKIKFQNNISSEKLDYNKLVQVNDLWKYKDQIYQGVIFAEGYQYIYNPYFSYLPNNFTKGEIIEVKTSAFEQKMITRGCFIVPQKTSDSYLIGSTYRWHTVSPETTSEAKDELIEKLEKVTSNSYTVYNQLAGIRPTMNDRRPLVGEHPKYKGLYIFNGMGSKTVMMAPPLALDLIDLLTKEKELSQEVDISRHTKKHFHKFETYEATKMSKL